MLYSYACSYKARVEARVKGDAEYIPNKLQFIHSFIPELNPNFKVDLGFCRDYIKSCKRVIV